MEKKLAREAQLDSKMVRDRIQERRRRLNEYAERIRLGMNTPKNAWGQPSKDGPKSLSISKVSFVE